MNEELIYKEIINPELLQSMEIEIEIHKLRRYDKSHERKSILNPNFQAYHQGTGDYLDDLLCGRQIPEIRDKYVIDYTRGGKDRAKFEDMIMKEQTEKESSNYSEKPTQRYATIREKIRDAVNMGMEFLNS